VQHTADELVWAANGDRVVLPNEWAAVLRGRDQHTDVLLGVRPENVLFVSDSAAGSLPAEVYLAEALGNETLVRLQIGGQELVARADASYEPAIGAHVWVQPDLRHAHLFDARTEQRIV
jgi:ABC-type sugar transport system ATPase subunit